MQNLNKKHLFLLERAKNTVSAWHLDDDLTEFKDTFYPEHVLIKETQKKMTINLSILEDLGLVHSCWVGTGPGGKFMFGASRYKIWKITNSGLSALEEFDNGRD